jgi:hypothetical protein
MTIHPEAGGDWQRSSAGGGVLKTGSSRVIAPKKPPVRHYTLV